jgi:hypothetical protein
MKPTSEPSTQEVLAGLVERVAFHNSANGFCVLRAKARGHRDLVTMVGHAVIISAGEWITASGEWINDCTHGPQFRARFLETSAPSSIDGIEKYPGSGMIRGIGPVYAKKMVKAFGEKVFDIIEAEPDRLREVTGIGAVRARGGRDRRRDASDHLRLGSQVQRSWAGRLDRSKAAWASASAERCASRSAGLDHRKRSDPRRSRRRTLADRRSAPMDLGGIPRVVVAKQTLSRELRAMGYRKLSTRPRHHAQAAGAIEDFK